MTTESLAWIERPLPADKARELTSLIVNELRALPPRQRAEAAERAKLPISATHLGIEGVPLLRMLIEDDVLRPFFGDGAVRIWLQLDNVDGLASMLAHADSIASLTLLQALERIDASEIYDVVEHRLERDDNLRFILTSKPDMFADARFIELALKILQQDPESACRILGANGSQRAIDELMGIVERATSLDGNLRGALHGLFIVRTDRRALDAAVMLLRRPFADALSTVPPFRSIVDLHAYAIRNAIGNEPAALRALELCQRAHFPYHGGRGPGVIG